MNTQELEYDEDSMPFEWTIDEESDDDAAFEQNLGNKNEH